MDCLAGPLAVNLCVLAQRQQSWHGILHFGDCSWEVYLLGIMETKENRWYGISCKCGDEEGTNMGFVSLNFHLQRRTSTFF
jgi:hypothetical protein